MKLKRTHNNQTLSTVELPPPLQHNNYKYETALFTPDGESTILANYHSEADAVIGHIQFLTKLNFPIRP